MLIIFRFLEKRMIFVVTYRKSIFLKKLHLYTIIRETLDIYDENVQSNKIEVFQSYSFSYYGTTSGLGSTHEVGIIQSFESRSGGNYILKAWGSEGWSSNTYVNVLDGKGGYSVGVYEMYPNQTIFILI
jgi:hypothetical protein